MVNEEGPRVNKMGPWGMRRRTSGQRGEGTVNKVGAQGMKKEGWSTRWDLRSMWDLGAREGTDRRSTRWDPGA